MGGFKMPYQSGCTGVSFFPGGESCQRLMKYRVIHLFGVHCASIGYHGRWERMLPVVCRMANQPLAASSSSSSPPSHRMAASAAAAARPGETGGLSPARAGAACPLAMLL